jgi:hypothetical protein
MLDIQEKIFQIKKIRLNILKFLLSNKCQYCKYYTKSSSNICLSCIWVHNNTGIKHIFVLQE